MSLRKAPAEIWAFGKEVVDHFVADDCPSMAASLAYATVFSLAPLVVIVMVITGLITTPQQAYQVVNDQLQGLVGQEGASQIAVMVQHVQSDQTGNLIARIVGGVVAAFGATGVMVQLQSALNRTWGVIPDPKSGGLRNFVFKRLLSFAMILAIAFLLLVSLVLTALLTAVATHLAALVPNGLSFSMHAVDFVVSLIVITALFAAIYKVMPDAKIRWRDVAVGAFATALLFTIGRTLIGFYLGQSNVGTAYGAASSFAILLIWVYYSSAIVLLGAEFTRVWTHRYGLGLEPERGARVAREPGLTAEPSTA